MEVRPSVFTILKMSCCAGRRKSQSSTITFISACAMATARFASVVDLPSSGPALVSSRRRRGLSMVLNWMFVLSVRYASAAGERGSETVTMSGRLAAIEDIKDSRAMGCGDRRQDLIAEQRMGLGGALDRVVP